MSRYWLRFAMLASLLASHVLLVPAARAATTCSATATSVIFGTVSLTGDTDVTATFNVTCSTTAIAILANAKVRMCLNMGDGVNGGGNFNPRRMLNGFSEPLQFQLYTDAARTQIWGSRGNASVPNPLLSDFDYSVTLIGGSQTKTMTIYGRVPTQVLIAGNYTNPFTGIHTSLEYRYAEVLIGSATFPASCISGGTGGATVSGAFPFTATATVPVNCRAYAHTDLDFGSVPGLITADVDNTSTLTMTCTGRTPWQVGLDNGTHASGTVRRMQLGATANFVTYELYRTSARNTRWGGTLNTDTVPGAGTGSPDTLTVYGRVPATQIVPAGSYSDVITVTVTY